MRRALVLLCLVCLIGHAALAQQPAPPALDTLVLNTGAAVACRVLENDEKGVRIEYISPTDRKTQTREVPWEDILHIQFAMDDAFRSLLKDPTAALLPQMLERWTAVESLLSRPKHPAGDLGLAIGRSALLQADAAKKQAALAICGQLELNDWDSVRRDQARWLRVQLLDALSMGAEALAEARVVAGDPAVTPALAMQAHIYVANQEFTALKKLEEDNPLWLEDDLVRPDRDQIFHTALDHYLRPSLFHGALEETATRGLWGAVQLLDFDRDSIAAAERARDLIQLYPQAAAAKQATDYLAAKGLPLEPPEEEPEELQAPQSEEATSEPDEREPAVKRRERYTRPPAKDAKR
jgi:hypothetical protein